MALTHSKLPVVDWGEIPYKVAFERQKQIVDAILAGTDKEQLVFCSHPPVVTLGRGTQPGDVFGWSGETVEVNRGGRATYHGPSQLVMYPLVYVGKPVNTYLDKALPPNDLHAYMRVLEQSVIDLLKTYSVTAQAKPLLKQVGDDLEKEATGVWIGDQKIAAIGIAVKGWVTSHGMALNLYKDDGAFQGINPCGFRKDQVISLEEIIHKKVNREDVKNLWAQLFIEHLLKTN